MRRPTLMLAALTAALVLEPVATARVTAAENATKFYEDNCSGCHTIGGGADSGPDLKGVTARRDRDWLIRFLLDPEAFTSDPEVARMIKDADGLTMPAIPGMTREMADAIVTLIAERSGTAQARAPRALEVAVTPADVARGRDLFIGVVPLSAAGPACIACHEAAGVPAPGGGRLGPDLTRVHERLGGRRGLVGWLGSTPTPMMRAVYHPAPLTRDEAAALAAFLEQSAAQTGPRPSLHLTFAMTGVGGAILAFGLLGLVWSRRFHGVRRPLLEAARGERRGVHRHAPGSVMTSTRTPESDASDANPGGPR